MIIHHKLVTIAIATFALLGLGLVGGGAAYATNYSITYNDSLVSNVPVDVSSTSISETVNISSTVPTRAGYDFKGWCTTTPTGTGGNTDNCSGTTYAAGGPYTLNGATANNLSLIAMWGRPSMQDFAAGTTSTTCASMNPGDKLTLADSRDGTNYTIGKLADGKCWMLDNLALDLTTVSLATLKGNTNATDQTLTYLKNGGGSSPYPSSGVSKSWTSSSQDSYNLPYITVSGTCYDAYCVNTPSSGNWTSEATTQAIINSLTSVYQGKIGVYYNYCAASAGSYCYADGSGTGNATEDICPAGWRLPTGGSSGEFQALYTAYSSNPSTFQTALATPLSGYFYSGTARDQGRDGRFWSSTFNNSLSMYYLAAYAAYIYPSSSSIRYYGYSVRCVMKAPSMQDATSSQLTELMPNTGDTATLEDARDHQTYTVAKLADGKYWMAENLNLAGGTALSADDTDVTSTYISGFTTQSSLAKSGSTIVLPNSSISGFSNDNIAYIYNSSNKSNCGASGQNTPCYSYYSWLAATLGGKQSNGSAAVANYNNAAASICPKGWRLPTSTTSNTDATTGSYWKTGDWYALAKQYGASLESNYYDSSATTGANFYNNAGPGETIPKFLLAGYYYGGTLSSSGTYGDYWSATSISSAAAYKMTFSSSYVYSAGSSGRKQGSSVRCLFKGQ